MEHLLTRHRCSSVGSSFIYNIIRLSYAEPFFWDIKSFIDVKIILRTMESRNGPWHRTVCAVGSAHAAGPAPDHRTSECRHPDTASSFGGVTRRHPAPPTWRRGTQSVRPPRSLPSQRCQRYGKARIGAPCTGTLVHWLRGQRALRPRVRRCGGPSIYGRENADRRCLPRVLREAYESSSSTHERENAKGRSLPRVLRVA